MKNSSGIPLLLVLSAALLAAPVCGAQSSSDTTQSSAELSKRVADLEKQLNELQSQLSSLKQSAPPAAPAAATVTTPSSTGTPAGANAVVASTPDASAPPSKVSIASLLGPTSVSGFVDGYYNYNVNQPATRQNSFRSFDVDSNTIALNMVELMIDKAPDAAGGRTGYRVALGFGQAMNAINSTDPGGLAFAQYLKEAYFSYLAPVGKGLQVDFGKFATPMGAEVIETKDNWNYSRSLLFSYAIPYYHYGARAKYAFNDKYALTGYFINGWNDIVENNTGKTYGTTFGWTPNKKWALYQNAMWGPEQANYNSSWRQTYDTVASFSPNSKLSLMANFDYGRGDRPIDPITGQVAPTLPVAFWTGIAGYVKYAFNEKWAFAARYEYYNDHSGFTTGTAQHFNEFTTTMQRMVTSNLMTRLEFRRDMSNEPTFLKGSNDFVTAQNTLAAGLIFMFDSREAK